MSQFHGGSWFGHVLRTFGAWALCVHVVRGVFDSRVVLFCPARGTRVYVRSDVGFHGAGPLCWRKHRPAIRKGCSSCFTHRTALECDTLSASIHGTVFVVDVATRAVELQLQQESHAPKRMAMSEKNDAQREEHARVDNVACVHEPCLSRVWICWDVVGECGPAGCWRWEDGLAQLPLCSNAIAVDASQPSLGQCCVKLDSTDGVGVGKGRRGEGAGRKPAGE